MANTFIEDLNRLSAGNFLGGLAQVGNAYKEQKQNDSLVNLYNQYKTRIGDMLQTTTQQIDGVNKTAAQQINEQDKNSKMFTDAANFATTLANSINRLDKWDKISADIVPVMMTLGEDGMRMGKVIADQIDKYKSNEEAKAKLPIVKLQYAKELTNYEWDLSKKLQWEKDVAKNEDLQKVNDAIASNDVFLSMQGEEIYGNTDYGNGKILEHRGQVIAIVNSLKEKFPEISDGVLNEAVFGMINKAEKGLKSKQVDPLDLARINLEKSKINLETLKLNAANQQLVIGAINDARYSSQVWMGLTDEAKKAYSDYRKNGRISNIQDSLSNVIDERFLKELDEYFAPGGKLDNSTTILAHTFGSAWYDVKYNINKDKDVRHIGWTQVLTDEEIAKKYSNQNQLFVRAALQGSQDIIRVHSSSDLYNGSAIYDPTWVVKMDAVISGKADKLKQKSLFNVGDAFDSTYSDLSEKQQYLDFMLGK